MLISMLFDRSPLTSGQMTNYYSMPKSDILPPLHSLSYPGQLSFSLIFLSICTVKKYKTEIIGVHITIKYYVIFFLLSVCYLPSIYL